MLLSNDWKDFELIDAGGGEKLERWGNYILRRPDPQAIWPLNKSTVLLCD
jgi:23S rRNA (cytosine1962-C5)-methyltransferase